MNITNVGIIGVGKMGAALTRSLCHHYKIKIFDHSESMLQSLLEELQEKVCVANNLSSLLKLNQPLILAVKPHQIQELIQQVPDDRLIISIAAGVRLDQMSSWRKQTGPIIRAMPNMPIQIGMGMTCLIGNTLVDSEMMCSVEKLFSSNGETTILEDEAMFHIVTALSGSGPALVYLFLQSLEDSGVDFGLDRKVARKLVLQTILGSTSMAKQSLRTPQDLIHDITSPGGTTIGAISSLKKGAFESSLYTAIECAVRRSKSLGKA